MISMSWIDKPRGMLLVDLRMPHLGGGVCWIPLRTWAQTTLRTKKNWWKSFGAKSTVKRKQLVKRKIENIVSASRGDGARQKGKC